MTPPTAPSSPAPSLPAWALVLSLAGLAVPLVAHAALPGWAASGGTLVVWLPAMVPALLMAHFRGWAGAAVAFTAGLVTLSLVQVEVALLGLDRPAWQAVLAVVVFLGTVTLGAGWMAEALRSERRWAREAALLDPLTELPNRRHASLVLDSAWARATRAGDLAVVLFDLDQLKEVNRRHGKDEGDRVLQAFARMLEHRTRRLDLSARWGGEEFITILVASPMREAADFADDVRARFASLDFGWGSVTASAGVSALEEGMGSPEVLLAAADRALHHAKSLGRDRIRRADQPMTALPAGESVPHRPTSAPGGGPASPPTLEGLRVLLVDDDPAVLRATARLLERMGCSVRAEGDPRHAIETLSDGPHPQLVVTDIIMPEMSGFTLVDLASRAIADLPALYMSGYPQEEVYWGRSPGARSTFLSKPLEAKELEAALLDLIRPVDADAGAEEAGVGGETPGPDGEPLPAPPEDGSSVRPGRILVLDDEESVVAALQRIFTRAGYGEPVGLTDPTLLPGILARQSVDLLLLDLHMPQMDGFQVLEELPRHLGEGEYLPVLVLTGDDDPDVRRQALAAGANDFLRKPFDVAEARARVQNLLETRFLNQRVARQRDEMEERVMARTAELADTRTEILHRLARAAEYRDDVTGRHAERVGLLSSLLASELGFPPREVDIIRRTAPLHDIGKIGIPDAVLRKPGRLTRSEFELMKTHTLIGDEILGGGRHRILQVAAEIARCHHEQWDGKGYPHGLTGPDIPISARLVSVADTFDTLTHNRPYKNAHPVGEVIEEIRRCRGTQFDPRVVDAFEAIRERVGAERFTQLADPLDPQRDIYTVTGS